MNPTLKRSLMPLGLTAMIALGGCTTSQPMDRPELSLPSAFQSDQIGLKASKIDQAWWQSFGQTRLNQLIETGLKNNPDIRIATERVLQAEVVLRNANTSLFPSLQLNGQTGSNARYPNQGASTQQDSTSLSLVASYELDLWQRNAMQIEASEAALSATRFDLDAARLSLSAAIAQAYFETLAQYQQQALAQKHLEIAHRLLNIVEVQYQNGIATPLDISRQKTTVLSRESALLNAKNQYRQSQFALAVLIGATPDAIGDPTIQLVQLQLNEILPGLPSDLLKRRPDIAASEARIQSANASVQAVQADLFPRINLSASGGLASSALLALTNPASTLALAAGLSYPLFDGGQSRNAVEASKSQYREAFESYRKTLLNALHEVETALVNIDTYRSRETTQQAILIQAELSLTLASARYEAGAEALTTVLDAQSVLFDAQSEHIEMRQLRLASQVDLYKVLGGGWSWPPKTS